MAFDYTVPEDMVVNAVQIFTGTEPETRGSPYGQMQRASRIRDLRKDFLASHHWVAGRSPRRDLTLLAGESVWVSWRPGGLSSAVGNRRLLQVDVARKQRLERSVQRDGQVPPPLLRRLVPSGRNSESGDSQSQSCAEVAVFLYSRQGQEVPAAGQRESAR